VDNPDLDAEYEAAMSALAADGLPEYTPASDLSHDALALGVGQLYADQWRYVDLWGHWYLWAGTHWQRDDKRRVWTLVREFVRDRAIGLDTKTATKLRAAETIAATVNLSRSNVEFAALAGDWDRDPYLLGTPAGTVDLRSGELREARPGDFITKLTAVAPAGAGAAAPLWQATLARIFAHDGDLVPFFQRALGYALTGEIKDHVLLFAWGMGGNGKGLTLNTASRVLGDYAAVAPQDLLLVTQSDLRGARLVTAQELVLCPRDNVTNSSELCEDVVGGCGPGEGT
jgi:putative DNA primase/helicase